MEHIDDYDLFDKDPELFLQKGREAFEFESQGIRGETAAAGNGKDMGFIRIFTPRKAGTSGSHLSAD